MKFKIILMFFTVFFYTHVSIAEQPTPVVTAVGNTSNSVAEELTFSQLNEMGIAAYRQNDYIQAVSYYEQALVKNENDIGALNNLALALLKLKKFDESIALSNKVIGLTKNKKQKANAYFNKGSAQEYKGEIIYALQSYRNANELAPSQARLDAYERMNAKAPRRYSGTDWSEGEIKKYLKKPSLKISERGVYKNMMEACENVLPYLKALDFSFVRPNFVFDDWDDIQLDLYKEKYSFFKYGMGYEMNSPDTLATIPTWNILIYDLDIDQDMNRETVMYGERFRLGTYERNYERKYTFGLMRPHYRVFEFVDSAVFRGVDYYSDPQSLKNESDRVLSAVININNIISVLVVSDVVRSAYHDKTITVVFLGKQTLLQGSGVGSQSCSYNY